MRLRHDRAYDGRKKEAPAIDEGEEARLCGGLWTKSLKEMLPGQWGQVNCFDEIFSKNYSLGDPHGRRRESPPHGFRLEALDKRGGPLS